MVKCSADENSRCVHECDGEYCRAYYHHEEDRCFGTCDPKEIAEFLPTQIAYQVGLAGWQSTSSADLKKVLGVEIARAAMTAKVLARNEPIGGEVSSGYLNMVINVADNIFDFITTSNLLASQFNISWHEKDIQSSLEVLNETIRGLAMNV